MYGLSRPYWRSIFSLKILACFSLSIACFFSISKCMKWFSSCEHVSGWKTHHTHSKRLLLWKYAFSFKKIAAACVHVLVKTCLSPGLSPQHLGGVVWVAGVPLLPPLSTRCYAMLKTYLIPIMLIINHCCAITPRVAPMITLIPNIGQIIGIKWALPNYGLTPHFTSFTSFIHAKVHSNSAI